MLVNIWCGLQTWKSQIIHCTWVKNSMTNKFIFFNWKQLNKMKKFNFCIGKNNCSMFSVSVIRIIRHWMRSPSKTIKSKHNFLLQVIWSDCGTRQLSSHTIQTCVGALLCVGHMCCQDTREKNTTIPIPKTFTKKKPKKKPLWNLPRHAYDLRFVSMVIWGTGRNHFTSNTFTRFLEQRP